MSSAVATDLWRLTASSASRPASLLCLGAAFALFQAAAPQPAMAQSVGMSCAQAVATYERNGRINVTTRTGTTLPIYDGVPVSQRNELRCSTTGIVVRATDVQRCTIAYKCQPRGR